MKSAINIIIIIIMFSASFVYAQDSSKKVKIYKVLITTESAKMKGFLLSIDSLGLTITENPNGDSLNLVHVQAHTIKKIKIGRKGQVSRGALYGALGGTALGFLIGILSGDDDPGWFAYSKEEKALGGAIVFGTVGAMFGTLFGTSRKRVVINYNIDQYLQNWNLLKSYEPKD